MPAVRVDAEEDERYMMDVRGNDTPEELMRQEESTETIRKSKTRWAAAHIAEHEAEIAALALMR
ncbi:MAG: hypothetical protein OXH45_10205 [Gammaproteobacteria bacterium]|nr:hypothetical protein [Gammaproteobacteria bacterium]